ncbi:MAG: hypothetical protein ACFFDS_03200 [Candidatus Thorarchaeota archaeon]
MSEEDTSIRKRRILRFIRDLDLRYIRGSIDRRTYQTLKNKYQEIMTSLPSSLKTQEQLKAIEETIEALPQLESDIHEIEKKEVELAPTPPPARKIEIPAIELESIPIVEIEELKVRYVMNLAIKGATKTFEEEMNWEQDYIAGKINDQDYLAKRNEIEAKQHKIFQHFYKLSELLFSVNKDHLYKNTHNNFLLFNNELSENINRLRRMETEKKELKGIIYDINERVLRHRPILKKAAQDTLNWKVTIQQEKEKFSLFYETNKSNFATDQAEELERKIKQLEIYEELLDEDINDYAKDLDAMDVIYGEHLRYQEIITPYFKDLALETEDRIQKYSEVISYLQFKPKLAVSSSFASRDLDYQLMSELKSLWRYSGKPVLDTQKEIVGFLVGPGQLNDQYGIIIRQQQEVSYATIRRIFDLVVTSRKKKEDLSEEEKKDFLLNEIPKTIPQISFPYLIPDILIEYCKRKEHSLSDEIKQVILQPENYLFVPIDYVTKSSREINISNQNIMQNGDVLPYFNPTESNMISEHLVNSKDVEVIDIIGNNIGKAHSVIYHPDKGYFLVVKNDTLSKFLYEQIYDFLFTDTLPSETNISTISTEKKKLEVISKLAEEHEISKEEVDTKEFLQKYLIEKNTGILPEKVENAQYILYSLGNVRIISDTIQLNYGSPSFELTEIFDLQGKVVENVKGTEVGVVFNLKLLEKPVLNIWTSIDLMLIASFIHDNPEKLFEEDKNFIDNLAISIGKQLSIAPQIALRPDIVMTFMNLSGKISDIDYMQETMEKFNPKTVELSRIISVDKRKILADLSDKEIMEEIYTDIEVGEIDDEHRYVTSPDYFLRDQ